MVLITAREIIEKDQKVRSKLMQGVVDLLRRWPFAFTVV